MAVAVVQTTPEFFVLCFLFSLGVEFCLFHACWWVAAVLSDLNEMPLTFLSDHLSILFRLT